MRKSELCKGIKGDVAKKKKQHSLLCHLLNETCKKYLSSSCLIISQCIFFWYNIEICSSHLQSSGIFQDRAGELREHSIVSEPI